MPWVKFSDDWYDDYELVEAGPAVMLLWTIGITWCARNLTDGRIPQGQIARLADWPSLGVTAEQVIAPLLANGRLQAIEGGYQFTNYLKFQPSRAQVLEEREAAKGRAAKSRQSSAHVQRTSNRSAVAPVPDPVPDSSSSSSSTSDLVPAEVWTGLARKKLNGSKNVNDTAAWLRKVVENDRSELGDRAAWLWETYDITPSQLVDVLAAGGSSSLLNSLRKRDSA